MISLATVNPNYKERRYPRAKLPFSFLVAWRGGGRRDANRARNLCLGGLHIVNQDPLEAGNIVHVLFDTPEGEVRARAIVRNAVAGRGMGVEFLGMDFSARRRLDNFLKLLLS